MYMRAHKVETFKRTNVATHNRIIPSIDFVSSQHFMFCTSSDHRIRIKMNVRVLMDWEAVHWGWGFGLEPERGSDHLNSQ